MYPHRQLSELAVRKSVVQARITVHRLECAAAAAELSRPIAVLDRGLAAWQRISPFVKMLSVPTGFVLTRWLRHRPDAGAPAPRKGKFATLLAALPAVLQGMKLVRGLG